MVGLSGRSSTCRASACAPLAGGCATSEQRRCLTAQRVEADGDVDVGVELAGGGAGHHHVVRVIEQAAWLGVELGEVLAEELALPSLREQQEGLEVGPPGASRAGGEAVAHARLDEDADRLEVQQHAVGLGEVDLAPGGEEALEAAVLLGLLGLLLLAGLELPIFEDVLTHHEALLARHALELLGALLEDDDREEAELGVLGYQLGGKRDDVVGELHVVGEEVLVRVLWDDHEQRGHVLRLEVVVLGDELLERAHKQVALHLALEALESTLERIELN
mmetsp:Transcript_648/g.1178  ORF Transcript_648/g.1178 Transcript_648/m.1178 type:complete len:277 (-) Transcript_648:437-1267(-)